MHIEKQHQELHDDRPNWNLLIFAIMTLVAICLACGANNGTTGVGPKNIQVHSWPYQQCNDKDIDAYKRNHACGIVAERLIEGHDIVTAIQYALITCEGSGHGCSALAVALEQPGGIDKAQRLTLREKAYEYCMNSRFENMFGEVSDSSTAGVCRSVARLYREDPEIQKLGLKVSKNRLHALLKRSCNYGDTDACNELNTDFDEKIDVEAVQRENDRNNENRRKQREEERAEQARFEATQKPFELPTPQPDAIQGALNHQMALMNTAPTGGGIAPPISAPEPTVTWPDMESDTKTPSKPPPEKEPEPTPPAKTSEPAPEPPPSTPPAPSSAQPPPAPPPPPPEAKKEDSCTRAEYAVKLIKFLDNSGYCKTNNLGNIDMIPVLKNVTNEVISCRVCGGANGHFDGCVLQTWNSQETIGGWTTPLVWCDKTDLLVQCLVGSEGVTAECFKKISVP